MSRLVTTVAVILGLWLLGGLAVMVAAYLSRSVAYRRNEAPSKQADRLDPPTWVNERDVPSEPLTITELVESARLIDHAFNKETH